MGWQLQDLNLDPYSYIKSPVLIGNSCIKDIKIKVIIKNKTQTIINENLSLPKTTDFEFIGKFNGQKTERWCLVSKNAFTVSIQNNEKLAFALKKLRTLSWHNTYTLKNRQRQLNDSFF